MAYVCTFLFWVLKEIFFSYKIYGLSLVYPPPEENWKLHFWSSVYIWIYWIVLVLMPDALGSSDTLKYQDHLLIWSNEHKIINRLEKCLCINWHTRKHPLLKHQTESYFFLFFSRVYLLDESTTTTTTIFNVILRCISLQEILEKILDQFSLFEDSEIIYMILESFRKVFTSF